MLARTLGVDLAMTTNGATLRLLRRVVAGRRVAAGQHQPRHARSRQVRADDAAGQPAPRCSTASMRRSMPGFEPVKINAVVERGVNDDEIVALASFGRERRVEVRFIEFMPLDAGGHWANSSVVSQDEIVDAISADLPARAAAGARRGARRPLALPRRRRHRRRDPDRHAPVLRRLRPSAPHRRRPVPHLPLRHRRVRPARCDSPAVRPTTTWRLIIERAVGTANGPGTGSTR